MRFFVIFIFIFSVLFSTDLDFDGIEDSKDYCPRTPFLAIVNKNGCEINKKFPFNLDIEIGQEYIFPKKIPQQYLKTTLFHKSFESSFYISRVKLFTTFHTYTKLFDISKKIYIQNGYYKLSFIYYPTTYYNKSDDKAYKLTFYFSDNDILLYYKFKKTGENYQKNKHTIFIEKFLKYPKIILIPFFFLENSYYNTKLDKYVGVSAIIRLKDIYTKFTLSKQLKEGIVFSFSIGKSF